MQGKRNIFEMLSILSYVFEHANHRSLVNLITFKDLKYNIILFICAHMAQNPHFGFGCKLCVIGDMQPGKYIYRNFIELKS